MANLMPLKKKQLEPVIANPNAAFQGAMPDTESSDLAFQANQQAQLQKTPDEIVAQQMAGVEQAGAGALQGATPGFNPGGNAFTSALANRSNRQYEQSVNTILQKQKLQAPMTQFQNTAALGAENQKDQELLMKRQSVRQAIDANNQNLTIREKQQVFEDYMTSQQQYLNEKHRELSALVSVENKRRATEAAKNQIISTILGTGGMIGGGVIGALVGGPVGAAAGAGAGGALGGAVAPKSSAQLQTPGQMSQTQLPEWKAPELQAPSLLNPSKRTNGSDY